jgi:hypothetical protein
MKNETRIEVQATTDGGFVSHVITPGVPDSIGYHMDGIEASLARLLAVYTRIPEGTAVMMVSNPAGIAQRNQIGSISGGAYAAK